jgi:hypothetical protein
MTNFKIGDKVKVKKLSEKEFKKVYGNTWYTAYMHSIYFDKTFIIREKVYGCVNLDVGNFFFGRIN